ncbi:hypothetical protein L249_3744 [Ophiocordyceps polyrhachis-furcata BCC 54312]|uniref:Ketoreductase (KR) domain-containing protein n=1 Tax=Ophiocordyceps polyrhachis-furcata BCC 54312 TaxID=1330021 RepID=A0A367L4J7_9HYPO|nr:hypothetical protein L249_3744 [Ophiocordyceps polyrhachis-furcata BCC 54312]
MHKVVIRIVDVLYGCLLYIPLLVVFSKRLLSRIGAREWDESQMPTLAGKVAVVTGANAGIGFQTARQLALHGAKVYLACRGEKKAKEAISRLREEDPSEKLVWLPLDLASQASVSRAARELREKETRLDILGIGHLTSPMSRRSLLRLCCEVNNAGIDPYQYAKTVDGFEMTMAVKYLPPSSCMLRLSLLLLTLRASHIGHWTLTYCLLPLLERTAAEEEGSDVRVVTVGSLGSGCSNMSIDRSHHQLSSPGEAYSSSTNDFTSLKDLDDPCSRPGWEDSCLGQTVRYGTSKLANILFASELQRRLDAGKHDILSLSINPGIVRTEGAVSAMPMPFMVRPLVWLFFTCAARGARTSLFAAAAEEVRADRGGVEGGVYGWRWEEGEVFVEGEGW